MAPLLRSARRSGHPSAEESVRSDKQTSIPTEHATPVRASPHFQSPKSREPKAENYVKSSPPSNHPAASVPTAKSTPENNTKKQDGNDAAPRSPEVNPNSLSQESIRLYLQLVRSINDRNPSPGESTQAVINEVVASMPANKREHVLKGIVRQAPMFIDAVRYINGLDDQIQEYQRPHRRLYEPQSPKILQLDHGKPLDVPGTPRPLDRSRHGRHREQERSERDHALKPRKINSAPKTTQERKEGYIADLDRAWGGRGWVPPYSRGQRTRVPVTFESLSSKDIFNLASVTSIAIKHRMPLASLFKAGGAIREAVLSCSRESNQEQPTWDCRVSQVALQYIRDATCPDNLEKRTAPQPNEDHGEDDSQPKAANVASEEASDAEEKDAPDDKRAAEQRESDSSLSQYSDFGAQSFGSLTPEFGRKMEPRPTFDNIPVDSSDIELGDKPFHRTLGTADLAFTSPLHGRKGSRHHKSSMGFDLNTNPVVFSAENEDKGHGESNERTPEHTAFNLSLGSDDMELSFTPKEGVGEHVISDSEDERSNISKAEKRSPAMRSAESALLQLGSLDAWLTDGTLELIQRAIEQHFDSESINGIHILDPLYLQVDSPSLFPSLPRKQTPDHFLCCLHHRHPKHWTLLITDTVHRRLLWYDPLPDSDRAQQTERRLLQWASATLPGEENFKFSKLDGPHQPDGHSCGVFVLEALFYWIRDRVLPSKLDAREARHHLITFISQPLKVSGAVPGRLHHSTIQPEHSTEMKTAPASQASSGLLFHKRPQRRSSQHHHSRGHSTQEAGHCSHDDGEQLSSTEVLRGEVSIRTPASPNETAKEPNIEEDTSADPHVTKPELPHKPCSPDSRPELSHVCPQNRLELEGIGAHRGSSKRRAPINEQEEEPRKLRRQSADANDADNDKTRTTDGGVQHVLYDLGGPEEQVKEGYALDEGKGSCQSLLDATATVVSQQVAIKSLTEAIRESLNNAQPLFNELDLSERQLRWLNREVDELTEQEKRLGEQIDVSEAHHRKKDEELQLDRTNYEALSKIIKSNKQAVSAESDEVFSALNDESKRWVDGWFGEGSSRLRQLQEGMERNERVIQEVREAIESNRSKRDSVLATLAKTKREVQRAKLEVDLGKQRRKLAELVKEYQLIL